MHIDSSVAYVSTSQSMYPRWKRWKMKIVLFQHLDSGHWEYKYCTGWEIESFHFFAHLRRRSIRAVGIFNFSIIRIYIFVTSPKAVGIIYISSRYDKTVEMFCNNLPSCRLNGFQTYLSFKRSAPPHLENTIS